jgi:phosphopantothenoylcysteine decarboxylase/phosphopantothenate--cysteine ligase
MPDPARARRVLFVLSGSIAAYKACHVVSRLVQAGCEVQTVATASALKFVGAATLEGLSGRPVATDTFEPGRAMEHIHLVRWADITVLCPATANTLNQLAGGHADDLAGTMFLAHDFTTPYLVAPAMNSTMYAHPATQRSIATLRSWGVEFLEPDAGALACGEIGPGRLTEPDNIVAAVLERLARPDRVDRLERPAAAVPLKVLVTSGGTTVPIDGVRSITNMSSGRTGAAIADHLAGHGHDVTLVHAAKAVTPHSTAVTTVAYRTFDDLDRVLQATLPGGHFDAVVHLAAVSDFDVDHLEIDGHSASVDPDGKLDSGDTLTIHLKRTPKLIAGLRRLAGPQAKIVGFKLTNGASESERLAAVAKLASHADLVVHNDLTEIDESRHVATIYRGTEVVEAVGDNAALARVLEPLLAGD